MTTLNELNGNIWYRFLKVLYLLFYLLYFLLLFLVLNNNAKDYHDPILPDNIQEVIRDPDFYKLNGYEMKIVLSSYDLEPLLRSDDNADDFHNIDRIIKEIKKRPLPTTPLKKKYEYKSFYTWNILDCIKYTIIITIGYIIIMESIRRSFYYVSLGKIFPNE